MQTGIMQTGIMQTGIMRAAITGWTCYGHSRC